jgi:hypothetical protein
VEALGNFSEEESSADDPLFIGATKFEAVEGCSSFWDDPSDSVSCGTALCGASQDPLAVLESIREEDPDAVVKLVADSFAGVSPACADSPVLSVLVET